MSSSVADRQQFVAVEPVKYTHRRSAETGLIHSYPRADLADSAIVYLVPRCSSDVMYPVRHARVELSCAAASTGGRFTWCSGCAATRPDQPIPSRRIR